MPIKSFYVASDGLYQVGLTPTILSIMKESNGSQLSIPNVSEVGYGWYKFTANPPTDDKLLGVIDCGDGLNSVNRYKNFDLEYYDHHKEVFLMPVYDADADSLTFFAFLQENGQINDNVASISITVYDNAHSVEFTVSSSTSQNGVFIVAKSSPGISNGSGYYASALVTKSDGSTIRSNETYVALD